MALMCIVVFAQASPACARVDTVPAPRYSIGLGAHAGYLLPQYAFLTAVIDAPIHSAELTISRRATGHSEWDRVYHYPAYGLSLFYSSLGNARALGREIALTYFVRYYWQRRGRVRVYNRLGIGGAYATRKFDPIDNYRNAAIGTHLNIHFNARLGVEARLSSRMHVLAGASFDHLSNANVTPINRGLNYVTAYVSVQRGFGAAAETSERRAVQAPSGDAIEAAVSVGMRRSRSGMRARASTLAASGEYRRRVNRVVSFGGGLDLWCDVERDRDIESVARASTKSPTRWSAGANAGATLTYNRFSWSLHGGLYVIGRPARAKGPLYNRAIMQYALRDRCLLRVAMKSHLHILDFPEFGVGYRWRHR